MHQWHITTLNMGSSILGTMVSSNINRSTIIAHEIHCMMLSAYQRVPYRGCVAIGVCPKLDRVTGEYVGDVL